MQEKYTDSARAVLRLAEKAVVSLGHTALGTEHILLGLLQEPTGMAGKIL